MQSSLYKWITIAGIVFIFIVKFYIRPYIHIPDFLQPVVDVAPNYMGCAILPFAIQWLCKKYIRFINSFEIQLMCGASLALVIVNEFLQLIPVFRRTFDVLDIVFSFAGIITGYYLFTFFVQKESVSDAVVYH